MRIVFDEHFITNLTAILTFYDERNGDSNYSKKLCKKIFKSIQRLTVFPQIGRQTNIPTIRLLIVDKKFIVEYRIQEEQDVILISDFYSCYINQ
jgi:plasmid stabilization system protein ParE